jgi:hypothetical protein
MNKRIPLTENSPCISIVSVRVKYITLEFGEWVEFTLEETPFLETENTEEYFSGIRKKKNRRK